MFIRTRRLFLRPAWPEDWQEVYSLINDQAIVHSLARAPWPYKAEHAREFVARSYEPTLPNFLITLPGIGGSRIIGSIGLQQDGSEVELGYWLGRPFWGQGFASEAGQAVLQAARALGHRRIVAAHFADNPSSGRVLRKIGFSATGQESRRYSTGRGQQVRIRNYRISLSDPCQCGGDEEDAAAARIAA